MNMLSFRSLVLTVLLSFEGKGQYKADIYVKPLI